MLCLCTSIIILLMLNWDEQEEKYVEIAYKCKMMIVVLTWY